jgi:hypothetical protein
VAAGTRGLRRWLPWAGAVLALGAAAGGLYALWRPSGPAHLGDEEVRELLEALGYPDWAEEADGPAGGVARYEEALAWPGYNLFNSRPRNRARLVDMRGEVVHEWFAPELGGSWTHIEMTPAGDLLVLAKGAYLARMDWNSRILWRRDFNAHHDLAFDPDGRIYTLSRHVMEIPHGEGSVPIVKGSIAVLSHEGELIEEVPLYELFAGRIPRARLDAIAAGERWKHGTRAPDVFHTNSIERIDRDLAGLPTGGDFLLCVRELDLVAIVDLDARRVEWSWGPGELDRPHDASVMEEDRILVFDNGKTRGWSRVVEVSLRTAEIVWQYAGDPSGSFFSSNMGGSQRLPNGNVLVTESTRGRAFEVTRDGRLVWEYFNPDVKDGRRGAIYRMTRIERAVAEPLLAASPARLDPAGGS